MARSRFRTHYGRSRHHPMVTRRAIRHHGFPTRFHRPVTGGHLRVAGHRRVHHREPPIRHVRSAHAGHLIARKAKRAKAVQSARAHRSRGKLSHSKLTGGQRVHTGHRKGGVHSVHKGQTRRHLAALHRNRHLSDETRRKISQALKGKHHPHRGHALSAETRAKISAALHARLKGRPQPHRGHRMSTQAREKISRSMKDKHHSRTRARKR